MCGACACRGRYLQQLPSSLAASARHRKDILARCRGRLQQLPRMYTGRTSRPRRRTRSSCAVVPSRHNQRCAKPHAVRIPWRTRGAACALGAPGALHALALSARCGCYRTVRLRSCALRHPHGATTIAVGRCERALEIMVGRFHRALQPRGVDDAPPRRSADRTLSIPADVDWRQI